MKPMLAEDWDPVKLKFPVGLQPKIDGVRGLTALGPLTGRSLKAHENRYTTAFFSKPEYAFLDGELAAQDERHPDLCRITSSALSTINGSPFVLWHVFDLLTPEALSMPYLNRHVMLTLHVNDLQVQGLAGHLRVVPMQICNNMEELEHWRNLWLEQGYEGTIIRGLDKMHKQGRSSPTQQGLLRIKDFVDFEFEVVRIDEGQRNMNPAELNELGHTFRSTHAENMLPNGMLGSMEGRVLKDVYDAHDKTKLLLAKDQIVTVGAGCMSHADREHFFKNQSELLGTICKAKFFPKGMKDKPRFPTYQSRRAASDMGGE